MVWLIVGFAIVLTAMATVMPVSVPANSKLPRKSNLEQYTLLLRGKHAVRVAQPCVDVKDKACVDECPVDCIYEGSRSLYINPNECVDCGACEPVCPTEAIFYEDDLPPEWEWYKDAAVEFFAEVGDLGGAQAAGPIGKDPQRVADLPPQNAA